MTDKNISFLTSPSTKQWQKLGEQKRVGVAAPLFSLYSRQSIGIGEFPDLKLFIDWVKASGMSLIQLLPLNDAGFKHTPYDAESSFALDPMYLSLGSLKEVSLKDWQSEIDSLRQELPAGQGPVNYEIKSRKLDLLESIFEQSNVENSEEFQEFCQKQSTWLEDYVLFKFFKEAFSQRCWEEWEEALREREPAALTSVLEQNKKRLDFFRWLQWQCFEQLQEAHSYAAKHSVYIMGDLPFLVSRDSADVWANQSSFKLNCTAGAPPDAFFAKGQRWGMPPYNWEALEEQQYDYFVQKLKVAETFYDLFRIDHAVGFFRVWTIALDEPYESYGLNGTFDPEEESTWEEHGEKLYEMMLANTSMLPCAEDLGVVPECSPKVLKKLGLPGMEIQRWSRDWGNTFDFIKGEKYRPNSMAVVSTHDMTPLKVWWFHEADTIDEVHFQRQCESCGIEYEEVKEELFDLEKSAGGRLRWKDDVADVHSLVRILNIPEEAWSVIEAFQSSYDERERFLKLVNWKGSFPKREEFHEFAKQVLKVASQSNSIFSIQLINDWLTCDPEYDGADLSSRINTPSTVGHHNWSWILPWSLEELISRELTQALKDLNLSTGRL